MLGGGKVPAIVIPLLVGAPADVGGGLLLSKSGCLRGDKYSNRNYVMRVRAREIFVCQGQCVDSIEKTAQIILS